LVVTRPVVPVVASVTVVVERRAVFLLVVAVVAARAVVEVVVAALAVVLASLRVVLGVKAFPVVVVTAKAGVVVTPSPPPATFLSVPGVMVAYGTGSVVAVDEGAPVVGRACSLPGSLVVGGVCLNEGGVMELVFVVPGSGVVVAAAVIVVAWGSVAGDPVVRGVTSVVGACSSGG
jgi:hypothetical protein